MANETTFTADRPEFSELRPDLLQDLRTAETEFRAAMQEVIEQLPSYLEGCLRPLGEEVPSRFIVGLLPVLRDVSVMRDLMEMQRKQALRRQGGKPN